MIFLICWADTAQEGGAIRGYVLDPRDNPIGCYIEACNERTKACPQSATTDADGAYSMRGLPDGKYRFKISADGFYPFEIRDVLIDGHAVKLLPVVRLEAGLIADCGIDRRPDYYRFIGGPEAGVGGVVTNDAGMPIRGATVTLYVSGRGPLASQKTKSYGAFSFLTLEPTAKGYRVLIARDGFFTEEQRYLTTLPGLESIYAPISMESCSPGRCQPYLKQIRVLGTCE